MVVFPNAKINLGLKIIRKRSDGFHDLETIFYPLQIKDALEIIADTGDGTALSFSGHEINGEQQDNLCAKAYRLLKKDFLELPAVKIHLHKNIPMGAGIGGGSADGAFTLQLLNDQFQLGISTEQLSSYAVELGSDCPFFLYNKPCLAKGRGEILEALNIDLSGYKILLVNPGIHINTGEAFSHLDPAAFSEENVLKKNITAPLHEWKDLISNDFEKPVFARHPEIGLIKEQLYRSGAIYSAMSGSGSSVFGIYEQDMKIDIKFPAHYFSAVV